MEEQSETDNEEVIKFKPEVRKPHNDRGVDSCYAWFVTAISFLIFVLSGGVTYSGGILLPELLASFPDTDEASASFVISMTAGMMSMAALCAGCFCEVYGWRKVCMVGSFMISSGYFTSSLVSSIRTLYFTYSTLIGVGLGFQFLPCIIVIQRYFTRRRTLATSIVSSGASVGVFIFAVIIRSLIDVYAWRGALQIMAGITLHALPLAMFLVSPVTPSSDEDTNDLAVKHSKTVETVGHTSRIFKSFKQLLKNLHEVASTLLKSVKDLAEPTFSLTVLAQFFKSFEKAVPYVMLPMKLLTLGYSKWQVATLVAVLGAGDFVGQLLVGIQSITCNFNKILFFACALFLAGLTEITVGFVSNYYGLCSCAFCLAVCTGIFISSTPPLLVDLVGVDRVPRSYGLICTGQGIGDLIGLPLLAVIYEVSGNINIPFYVCGAFPIIGFFLMILVYVLKRRKRFGVTGS